jgi:SAM-dependent methyltransferase
MTLLVEDPGLWDAVFPVSYEKVRFVEALLADAKGDVLDVGCATGALCSILRRRGVRVIGVDINPRFVAAAKAKDPRGEYLVGDMKTFRLRRRFRVLVCLGTTFSYNLTNEDIAQTLTNFRRHLKPGGLLVIDVLNAIAFVGPRPFKARTQHKFSRNGFHATATIRHRLNFETQTMTEQVSWTVNGRCARRDPEERLRLFFPQELAFQLQRTGYNNVTLADGYRRSSTAFGGRRLVAVATNSGSSSRS